MKFEILDFTFRQPMNARKSCESHVSRIEASVSSQNRLALLAPALLAQAGVDYKETCVDLVFEPGQRVRPAGDFILNWKRL